MYKNITSIVIDAQEPRENLYRYKIDKQTDKKPKLQHFDFNYDEIGVISLSTVYEQ